MSVDHLSPCVFVYGTLKRGYCRHQSIAQQKFVGIAETKAKYRLFDLGEYPGMIMDESGVSIPGELYEVDADCLERLDAIEGVGHGLYSCQPVRLLPPWDDCRSVTYIYEQSVEGQREIPVWPYPVESKTES